MQYNLEKRTTQFAAEVIILVKKLRITAVNKRIIEQLVGSSGSIGANYREANEAESNKDFFHKIAIAKKEIKETQHWLILLSISNSEVKKELRVLFKESQELLYIFAAIRRKAHV